MKFAVFFNGNGFLFNSFASLFKENGPFLKNNASTFKGSPAGFLEDRRFLGTLLSYLPVGRIPFLLFRRDQGNIPPKNLFQTEAFGCILFEMLRAALSLILFSACTGITAGQDGIPPGCPSISITGPAGVTLPGEVAYFTADIQINGLEMVPKLRWTVNEGEIVSGQGTRSIFVRHPGKTIVATLELIGLPKDCPTMASETVPHCEPIVPIKLYDLKADESLSEGDIDALAAELKEFKNDQLYILVGYIGGRASQAIREKERNTGHRLMERGIEAARITFAGVFADNEMMQFWRVPPGASNPRCEECEEAVAYVDCPSIEVVGPVSFDPSGPPPQFRAVLSGNVPEEIQYKWTVRPGEIISGQGTPEISVRSTEISDKTLTATVEINGLGLNCPYEASESMPPYDPPYPILVDEFPSDRRFFDKALQTATEELRNNPNDILYLIEYFPRRTSNFDIRDRQRRLMEFFTKELKVDESVVKVISAESVDGRLLIKVYRMPPGAEYPEP